MPKVSTSYKPGQSGNPKGRPKKEWTWAGLIREIGDEYPGESKYTHKQLAIKALWKKGMEGDVQAIKELGNRLDGMPVQKQDIKGDIKVSFHDSLKQDGA